MGQCITCGADTTTNYCNKHKWEPPDRPQVNPQPRLDKNVGVGEKAGEDDRDRERNGRDQSPFGIIS